MKNFAIHRRSERGFSLVEMLCVVAIISILAAMGTVGIQRITLSTNLTSSASMVVDALNVARQCALSANCPVEVRFYQVPDSTGSNTQVYRAVGIYEITTDGPQLYRKIIYLNGNVVLSNTQNFGTLLYYASTGNAALPTSGATTYPYAYFQFRPDGSTNLNPLASNSDTWHVMLYNSSNPPNGVKPPANYVTLQLDAVSGRTETFQP